MLPLGRSALLRPRLLVLPWRWHSSGVDASWLMGVTRVVRGAAGAAADGLGNGGDARQRRKLNVAALKDTRHGWHLY